MLPNAEFTQIFIFISIFSSSRNCWLYTPAAARQPYEGPPIIWMSAAKENLSSNGNTNYNGMWMTEQTFMIIRRRQRFTGVENICVARAVQWDNSSTGPQRPETGLCLLEWIHLCGIAKQSRCWKNQCTQYYWHNLLSVESPESV